MHLIRNMPCPYAFVLGVPGQGVHAPRIGGYARNDTIATIVLAIITSYIARIPFFISLAGWFVLGEVLHYAFGTQTAVLTTLGIRACPDGNHE
jgi:hypothetical protein